MSKDEAMQAFAAQIAGATDMLEEITRRKKASTGRDVFHLTTSLNMVNLIRSGTMPPDDLGHRLRVTAQSMESFSPAIACYMDAIADHLDPQKGL